jgi:hypothetical protein
MLGILISERTVSRILRGLPRPPRQTWKTFLHNHFGQLVSIDFFTVPTISMKVLFTPTIVRSYLARCGHLQDDLDLAAKCYLLQQQVRDGIEGDRKLSGID